MRVVGGVYGGRTLVAPKGMATRPTADRVREALFSILFDVEGLCVLDLYAGTGAIGIEAISRGARHATFVEHDRRALTAIEKNLAALAIAENNHRVLPLRAGHALEKLARASARFDLVFADPPYDDAARALPEVLRQSSILLAPGGRIVLELSSSEDAPPAPSGLQWSRTKRYGETALAFYAGSDVR